MTSAEFIDELARATKEQIASVVSPLLARLAVLEAKAAEPMDLDAIAAKASVLVPRPEHGRDGRDAEPVDLEVVAAKAAALVPRPEPGRDGRDADPVDLDAVAAKAAAMIPAPVNGKDGADAVVDVAAIAAEAARLVPRPDVASLVENAVKAIPMPKDGENGRDGRDVDAALLETIVSATVERVLATWEKPKDGASLTPADLAPLIKAEVAAATASLRSGADGVGITGALIDQDGCLQLTKSDGTTQVCGRVVGAPGRDADMESLRKHITDEIALIPTPRDGKDGAPGADGLGFDDMDAVIDDEKGLVFRWSRGDRVKEQAVPVVLDHGVYKPGVLYRKGAAVTAQGSLWIAQADTRERPGDGSTSWRLAVKKGRDGKDLRTE